MKLFVTVLLALLASVTSKAQTKTTFDKFKNATHFMTAATDAGNVSLEDGKDASVLIHRIGMVIGFACDGKVDSCEPTTVELLFIGYTSDWRMNGNSIVNLLIDGKPATAGKADWDGQVIEADNLVEYNDVNISPLLLARLAGAKVVDVQIGPFEFPLTGSNLAAIRDIATHMKASELIKPIDKKSGSVKSSTKVATP